MAQMMNLVKGRVAPGCVVTVEGDKNYVIYDIIKYSEIVDLILTIPESLVEGAKYKKASAVSVSRVHNRTYTLSVFPNELETYVTPEPVYHIQNNSLLDTLTAIYLGEREEENQFSIHKHLQGRVITYDKIRHVIVDAGPTSSENVFNVLMVRESSVTICNRVSPELDRIVLDLNEIRRMMHTEDSYNVYRQDGMYIIEQYPF